MARVWMHNGFLKVEGEKMSKCLGNFFTVHDLLRPRDLAPGDGDPRFRRLALSTHYRQPMDFTGEPDGGRVQVAATGGTS